MFSEEGGWPYGQVKDSDNILEKEKAIGESNPVRKACYLPFQSLRLISLTLLRLMSLLQNLAKPAALRPSTLLFP
jgi:hypothetical protein